MTAETSNARGEWALVPREPTKEMLDAVCSAEGIEPWTDEIMRQTYIAMLEAAPPPAAARGDVRGLVALAERVQYADTHALVSKDDAGEFVCLPPWLWLEIRDAAVEALAAEGVQAGEVEQRAREREDALAWDAVRSDYQERAIARAEQPEARGVVDELRRTVAAIGIVGEYLGKDTILRESVLDIIDRRIAALTGERNG